MLSVCQLHRAGASQLARVERRLAAAPRADPPVSISGLVECHRLPGGADGKLRLLLELLTGDAIAPIGARDPQTVIETHLADSLAALQVEQVRAASRVADIGAGAGLPGLPLAIALPETSVALVESSARKCAFMERAIGECGVSNAQVVRERVESWSDGLKAFDLVTARAIGPLEVVAEYAAPLLPVGGALLVWRGRRDREGEAAASRAGAELGLEPSEIRAVRPYPGSQNRHLHLMLKVRDTPGRFPRRAGVAAKRPLGRE